MKGLSPVGGGRALVGGVEGARVAGDGDCGGMLGAWAVGVVGVVV